MNLLLAVGLLTYMVEPCRFLDTRGSVPFTGEESRFYTVQGKCEVPLGAKAVILNLTAVSPTEPGYLSAWRFNPDSAIPPTSTLNFAPGQVVAGGATVRLAPVAISDPGAIVSGPDLWIRAVSGGEVHVVVDVVGYLR